MTVNFRTASLSFVLRKLLGDVKIPYRLASPAVGRARVTCEAVREPLGTVLQQVLASAGVTAAWEGETLAIRRR